VPLNAALAAATGKSATTCGEAMPIVNWLLKDMNEAAPHPCGFSPLQHFC